MKPTILAIFLLFLSLNSFAAHAEDACVDILSDHIQAINSSEELLRKLGENANEITPFQIIEMQKSMTARFLSLKNLLAATNDTNYDFTRCTPKLLTTALAIYDFSLAGKSIFANDVLRRVFLGFSKYPLYQLTDYISKYKKYTSNKLIEKTQLEIENQKYSLPDGVIFSKTQLDYDPNLFALSDAAINGTASVVAGAARIWGFISDHLKWRQGRLNNNSKAISIIRSKLKPLDLIYEKRTFLLSNYTIPGHWGHVAVWLGTKEELIALDIWDKSYFAPFQEFIESGRNIVEIRKEGLSFQSLETFINLDEIAITRIKNIAEDRADAVYEGLSEQAGKSYDFKFDARTADKITCAELISFSFGDIKWPETKTLFQTTLRPDDIALLSLDSTSVEEFVLYFKGTSNKDNDGFQSLGFKEWTKLFNTEKHLSPEENQFNNEEKAKSIANSEKVRQLQAEYLRMYSGT